MEQKVLQALAWPIYDVPRIFEISTRGFEPALPGIIGLSITVGLPLIGFPAKKEPWRMADLVLGYAIAAGVSFAFHSF